MPAEPVAVVGAGVAGLAAAATLAADRPVTVLDRLPVAGGVLGYEAQAVRDLVARCELAGVRFQLGTTAIRWQPGRLLAAGPRGIVWLEAERLAFAGGGRPATQAELRVAGPRLAGVLPAPVAIHLMEAQARIGRDVALLGTGDWARAAARELAHQGARVTVVAAPGAPAPDFPHEALVAGWRPAEVEGRSRVQALVVERDGVRHRIRCDAVVLAADARPLRNVDGAVLDGAPAVTFVQPVAERATHEWVATRASAAVNASDQSTMEMTR